MDYETPDGSQFSLREVLPGDSSEADLPYTTVSATIDGIAYTGKLLQPPDEVDDAEVLNCLAVVPPECIYPEFKQGFTTAPELDPRLHYLKAPSFTYEDCQPGKTFVADCLLNEVEVLERLQAQPHRNIVSYYGCMVKDGRATHLCLKRYSNNLVDFAGSGLPDSDQRKIIDGIEAGINHLHSLGLAHNDINPYNICIDESGEAIIVDFDGCLPFGEKLMKGVGHSSGSADEARVSTKANDCDALDGIEDWLSIYSSARSDRAL